MIDRQTKAVAKVLRPHIAGGRTFTAKEKDAMTLAMAQAAIAASDAKHIPMLAAALQSTLKFLKSDHICPQGFVHYKAKKALAALPKEYRQ